MASFPSRVSRIAAITLAIALASSGAFGSPSKGSRVVEALKEAGAISPYFEGYVRGIAREIFDGGVGLNEAYAPSRIGIYIVDPTKAGAIIKGQRLGHMGRAVAYEELGIVLISRDHLRELVTIAWFTWKEGHPTSQAVAATALVDLGAYGRVWDPSQNVQLNADVSPRWEMALRGAVAFLLAHEVAHIEMGAIDEAKIRGQMFFEEERDQDLLWMCPDMVSPKAALNRKIEQEADERAFARLKRHRISGTEFGRFEVGSEWYMLVLGEMRFVCAASVSEGEFVSEFLAYRYGPEVAARLAGARLSGCPAGGAISGFFPSDHPSVIQRHLTGGLATPEEAAVFEELQKRIDRECASLLERYRSGR